MVGICRAGSASGGSANSISRVMKVPIRMYNHVVGGFLRLQVKRIVLTNTYLVGRGMMPYDILWPVNTRLDAGISQAKVVEEVGSTQKSMFLWWLILAYQTDKILFQWLRLF